MLKEEVKAELSKRGVTFKQIAAEQEVAPATVSIVFKGDRRSRRIEQAIADKLGKSAKELFPQRYQCREDTQVP